MQYRYEYNDTMSSVRLERLPDGRVKAIIDGRERVVQVVPLADGRFLIQDAHGQRIASTASAGDQRYVQVDGQHYELRAESASQRRRGSAAASGDLSAQMPGQVTEIHVGEGDVVSAGDTLIVLEAMKMEIRVTAPADGRVQRLLVQPGDVVERGQSLIELGETEA